jgi:hypothetical protein
MRPNGEGEEGVCDGLAKHCHPSYQLHAVGAGWISLAQQKHAQWDTRTPKAARRPTPPYTNKVCVCSSGEGSRGQAFGLWAGSGAYGGAGTARNNVASQTKGVAKWTSTKTIVVARGESDRAGGAHGDKDNSWCTVQHRWCTEAGAKAGKGAGLGRQRCRARQCGGA